ncbi:MAG: low-specificity L-threonine aldolase [Chitinophagaceae bacterium]|nr:low-specificity L-threonine aldolase [Chitinophagaceae bacterium]
MIDYRSDTVTRPGKEMREAMLSAKVGDDVFEEDPTVNELQEYAASLFGMESALYCPSGTMTNQIAIKAHTRPGDEVVCEAQSHIYVYEGGGIAFNSGCQAKLIPGYHGRITADQVLNAINPDDIHKPRTRLVGLENTSNRGGGSCYDFNEIVAIKEVCLKNGLALHLDGARLFNAIIAKGETPSDYGRVFDSISICLSKGLGAPVGSLLLGNKDFINYARRIRKVFGGGMRQAGIIAAGGLYALKHNIERLKEDHHHAQLIAEALLQKSFISNMFPVETNILIFEVNGKYSAKSLADALLKNNIRVIPISPTQIRIVTHLDITPKDVDKTIHIINTL